MERITQNIPLVLNPDFTFLELFIIFLAIAEVALSISLFFFSLTPFQLTAATLTPYLYLLATPQKNRLSYNYCLHIIRPHTLSPYSADTSIPQFLQIFCSFSSSVVITVIDLRFGNWRNSLSVRLSISNRSSSPSNNGACLDISHFRHPCKSS